MPRTRKAVVEGWFAQEGEDFALLGTRCRACASVFFPREESFCRNPACAGRELDEVPLSRRGRVWSFTDGRYRPPAPYVSDPDSAWEPYVLLAVELEAERMVVLGQAPPGTTAVEIAVGMEVELVPGVLNEDDERTWTTWHWRPVPAAGAHPLDPSNSSDSSDPSNESAGEGATGSGAHRTEVRR